MSTIVPSLQRLCDVIEYLVDERVGIIRHVTEFPKEAGAPDLFYYYAQACDTRAFCPQKNFANAGGVSTDRGLAMAKALGEAVERYCAAQYEAEELPLYQYDSAPFRCVSPETFALYTPAQYGQQDFPYHPFNHQTQVRWVPALELATGERCYVPAAMVYVPYFYSRDHGELPIVQPISTGLACHCSLQEATSSAICEVIERDAFLITWQARLAMPQIKRETLSEKTQDLVKRFEHDGSSVFLMNITLDVGVPTILSVLRGRSSEAPALVFAASANLDPEQAVRKSLEELAHTRRLAQQLKAHLPKLAPGSNFENVVNQENHVHLYCDHDNLELADFVFASDQRVSFNQMENEATGDPERDVEILVEKMQAVNHRVFLADLTTDDIRALGLSVVRAIIPGFHPLFMGHRFRALGGMRLWAVPRRLGYQGITSETGDNPAPHPYP